MGSLDMSTPFTIKDVPLDSHRRMKVRVIGAGYSGIYLGIRIPQRLRNVDLQIYERHESIGGTWWLNKYPGCACDVPAHSYQYPFNPNPDWSSFYAPQPEICAYLHRTAEKYGVTRFVKTLHKVESCRWDDDAKKWSLTVHNLNTGETFEDDADVLISARGHLSDPAWPKIPGLKTFEGELIHSALWPKDSDLKNKRIGVIGNGSSAIQIVPKLQKLEGSQVSCFVRNQTWITNPYGDQVMADLGLDPKIHEFTDKQRQEFINDPEKLYKFRRAIEASCNAAHLVTIRDSPMQRAAVDITRAAMQKRLAKKPEIADFLYPSFGVGCRRPTPGPGYLEALVESNVDFITDPIAGVTPTGVTLQSGREVELDALVCATGFNSSMVPPFPVYGRGGVSLAERSGDLPEAYLSLAVDPFPNFFAVLGPNSGVGSGSLSAIIEALGDYIVKCVRKLQKEDYASMTIRPERVRDWSRYAFEYFKGTVYSDTCHSWYKSKEGGGDVVTGLWPGSTLHALEALRAPRWEDYEWESTADNQGNLLRWLGNGFSLTHTQKKKSENGQEGEGEGDNNEYHGDPAWYIDPRFVDAPLEGRPEEDVIYKMRPFSH
ncbi:flavin-binding monooxygenase [Biscogniauxia marginata]|nr:flavin-binding monooxygenase [Biscogniauxia marginata]